MIDRGLRAAAAALVIIVGVWAGVRVYSTWTSPPKHSGIATPVGEASPPLPSDLVDQPKAGLAGSDAKIPERLPAFALQDLGGTLTPIDHWKGKSLVINFWATWCGPCRREIPMLGHLAAQWADRGVVVVGIAVDHAEAVSNYARELKIPYPLLVGEQDALDAAQRLGMASPVFPFTVFTDAAGQVVALFVGELHPAQADLILSRVRSLDRHELSLSEARRSISSGLARLADADASAGAG
jgi:thiol-disulfide isomerase/thioredoxin